MNQIPQKKKTTENHLAGRENEIKEKLSKFTTETNRPHIPILYFHSQKKI